MEEHILVSNTTSEESDCIDLKEHNQVTTNPSSRFQTKKEPGSIMKESPSRGQSHSRESSGTSNLSVKFTIERETDSSTPSISESVSICSSPEVGGHKSKCETYSNYNHPPNKGKVKKKKHRSITESSGISSCAACENSSENEYTENCQNCEHELLEDGDTRKDDQCDNLKNSVQRTNRPNNQSKILEYGKVNAKMHNTKNKTTNTNSSNAIDTEALNQYGKINECNALKDRNEKALVENTSSKR